MALEVKGNDPDFREFTFKRGETIKQIILNTWEVLCGREDAKVLHERALSYKLR